MSKFVTAHVIACMTRQDVERLTRRFIEAQSDGIKFVRVLCDTMSSRMLCEWEAPDHLKLVDWLKTCHVQLRGASEWVMQVQFEMSEND